MQKFKLGDREYAFSDLSPDAKAQFESIAFADEKIKELKNMQALLQRAKNSYLDELKQEMLSKKAGFLLDD